MLQIFTIFFSLNNNKKKIHFAKIRRFVNYPTFLYGFSRVTFQLRKISKNKLLIASTTSNLLLETSHYVNDPINHFIRNYVHIHPQKKKNKHRCKAENGNYHGQRE